MVKFKRHRQSAQICHLACFVAVIPWSVVLRQEPETAARKPRSSTHPRSSHQREGTEQNIKYNSYFCGSLVCIFGEATEQAREQPPPKRFVCAIAGLLVGSLNRFTVPFATWLLDRLLACFVSSRFHFVLLFVCLCSFALFVCLFALFVCLLGA